MALFFSRPKESLTLFAQDATLTNYVFYCFDAKENEKSKLYMCLGKSSAETCFIVQERGDAVLVRLTDDNGEYCSTPTFKYSRGHVVEIAVEPKTIDASASLADSLDVPALLTIYTSFDSRLITKALKKERAVGNGVQRWTIATSNFPDVDYLVQTLFSAYAREINAPLTEWGPALFDQI